MRAVVLVRTDDPAAGARRDARRTAALDRFNGDLVNAGVLLAAEALRPGSDGVRLRVADGSRWILDGPAGPAFQEIAGVWLWQVRSIDEAVEWARRAPVMPGAAAEFEIRQVLTPGDRPGARR